MSCGICSESRFRAAGSLITCLPQCRGSCSDAVLIRGSKHYSPRSSVTVNGDRSHFPWLRCQSIIWTKDILIVLIADPTRALCIHSKHNTRTIPFIVVRYLGSGRRRSSGCCVRGSRERTRARSWNWWSWLHRNSIPRQAGTWEPGRIKKSWVSKSTILAVFYKSAN